MCSLCQMRVGLLQCFCAISSLPHFSYLARVFKLFSVGEAQWLPTNARGALCAPAPLSNSALRQQVLNTFGAPPYPIVMCTWMLKYRPYTKPYGTKTFGIRRTILAAPKALNSIESDEICVPIILLRKGRPLCALKSFINTYSHDTFWWQQQLYKSWQPSYFWQRMHRFTTCPILLGKLASGITKAHSIFSCSYSSRKYKQCCLLPSIGYKHCKAKCFWSTANAKLHDTLERTSPNVAFFL